MDLLLLKWDSIGLLRLGPEVGYREAIIEVCSVVVHYCYREHDVHSELECLISDVEEGRQEVKLVTYFEDFEIGTTHFDYFGGESQDIVFERLALRR